MSAIRFLPSPSHLLCYVSWSIKHSRWPCKMSWMCPAPSPTFIQTLCLRLCSAFSFFLYYLLFIFFTVPCLLNLIPLPTASSGKGPALEEALAHVFSVCGARMLQNFGGPFLQAPCTRLLIGVDKTGPAVVLKGACGTFQQTPAEDVRGFSQVCEAPHCRPLLSPEQMRTPHWS